MIEFRETNLIKNCEGEAGRVQNGEEHSGHEGGRDGSAEDEDQRIDLKQNQGTFEKCIVNHVAVTNVIGCNDESLIREELLERNW